MVENSQRLRETVTSYKIKSILKYGNIGYFDSHNNSAKGRIQKTEPTGLVASIEDQRSFLKEILKIQGFFIKDIGMTQ